MLVVGLFAAIVILACAAAAGLIAITGGSPEDVERLPNVFNRTNAAADTTGEL